MQLRLEVVGDNKGKEEGQKEEGSNCTTLLSSSSFHTMMVRRGEGGWNHTRTSKDKINHRPVRISRTVGRRRTLKHNQSLLRQQNIRARGQLRGHREHRGHWQLQQRRRQQRQRGLATRISRRRRRKQHSVVIFLLVLFGNDVGKDEGKVTTIREWTTKRRQGR